MAEKEAESGLMFKIVESGGRTVMHTVQSSNPTGSPGCHNTDCLACKAGPGAGGNCLKSNVQYELNCKLCPLEDRCTYIGETSRNLYTRAKEHTGKYNSKTQCHASFIKKHQEERHHGVPANFKGKVTSMFRDCLSRQVSEGVNIRRCDKNVLNSKSEWHQPALWRVQNEIVRE